MQIDTPCSLLFDVIILDKRLYLDLRFIQHTNKNLCQIFPQLEILYLRGHFMKPGSFLVFYCQALSKRGAHV